MQILSIGNSFSHDAQRYLHQIAAADGVDISCFNLFIGGCSLSHHYRNMLTGNRAYTLGMNGQLTGFPVSMEEALLNRDWDIVTLQQVSGQAPRYETYQPYLSELCAYVRKCVPKAKIALHQTWGYAPDSPRLTEEMGYLTHEDMFVAVRAAYEKAAEDIGADFILPSGETMCRLIKNGAEDMHRDPIHAGLGLGRYALGLTWYGVLTGKDIAENTFRALDTEETEERILLAKRCAAESIDLYQRK